jgi:uncharacterized protein YodC (DUF2158 family)
VNGRFSLHDLVWVKPGTPRRGEPWPNRPGHPLIVIGVATSAPHERAAYVCEWHVGERLCAQQFFEDELEPCLDPD